MFHMLYQSFILPLVAILFFAQTPPVLLRGLELGLWSLRAIALIDFLINEMEGACCIRG